MSFRIFLRIRLRRSSSRWLADDVLFSWNRREVQWWPHDSHVTTVPCALLHPNAQAAATRPRAVRGLLARGWRGEALCRRGVATGRSSHSIEHEPSHARDPVAVHGALASEPPPDQKRKGQRILFVSMHRDVSAFFKTSCCVIQMKKLVKHMATLSMTRDAVLLHRGAIACAHARSGESSVRLYVRSRHKAQTRGIPEEV